MFNDFSVLGKTMFNVYLVIIKNCAVRSFLVWLTTGDNPVGGKYK